MRLIGFAIYLGTGAMLHAVFVGPHFDWTSAWTFGWLFGWPIMMFISFWAVILIIFAAGAVVLGCIGLSESIRNKWRRRRYAVRKPWNAK